VDHGQRAGQLDAADGDGDDGDDLGGEQPSARLHVLAEDGDPVAGADQRVAQGERRLDGHQRAGLQGVLQQEQRADPGDRGPVQLPGAEERRDALMIQGGHRALHQRRGQGVAARGGQAERGGAGVAPGPHPGPDEDRLEDGGDDQGQRPDPDAGVVAAAGRRGGRQAGPEGDRDQADGDPGHPRQLAVRQLARHQQGERQLDDEDGLHQRHRTGGQRGRLAHRGDDDHGDAGQPDLVLDQVPEQRQVQRFSGRRGRGGHPLQDRGQPVEQRRKQREQNRHHCGILPLDDLAGSRTPAEAVPGRWRLRPAAAGAGGRTPLATRINALSSRLEDNSAGCCPGTFH
jgi:hypothetical protein